MKVQYSINFMDGNEKRLVTRTKDGVDSLHAIITKDPNGGYSVFIISTGKVKLKKSYAEARRSACRKS